jgi:endonuclease YncB( thermonuclease family)
MTDEPDKVEPDKPKKAEPRRLGSKAKRIAIRTALVLLALLMLLLLMPVCGCAQTITGKVVGVSDGDTITVLDADKRQHKVRLDGIDAPESNQDFGSRAKQSLSDLVFGKTVTVTSAKRDRYGRIVGQVLCDGKSANLEQF